MNLRFAILAAFGMLCALILASASLGTFPSDGRTLWPTLWDDIRRWLPW